MRGRVRGQRPPRDQGRGSGSRQLQSSLRPGARPLQHSSAFSPNSKFSLNAADEFWDLERNEETKPILLQADQCKKELRSYGHRINLKQDVIKGPATPLKHTLARLLFNRHEGTEKEEP